MPTVTGTIEADGALVEVLFGWSATATKQMRIHLHPIPQAMSARALLDTGAEITCLAPALIQALGLPARGFTPANVPAIGGLTFSQQHDTTLTILHPSGNASDHLIVSDLVVVEIQLTVLGYQALIGRDVLGKCRFLYDGLGGQFHLSY